MANYETVNILVKDSSQIPVPLKSVVVKLTSQDGKSVYGQTQTGADGIASFLLPSGNTYQARFYKFGYSFQASLIEVISDAQNTFTIKGEGFTYPQSMDPRICIAGGFFRTPAGLPAKYVDMHFIQKFDPLLLDGAAVVPERVAARTDAKGYVEVPLIRFGYYDVTLEGMEDYQRCVNVPDKPFVNIGDLLFPVVTAVSFEEEGPYTVQVGNSLTLHPHVFTSDLRELSDITSDLLWSTSNSMSVGISPEASSITLTAVTAGTYTLTATRRDQTIIRIPNTPVQGVPIQITVTP